MKQYENKNFRVSSPELVGTIVFLGLLLVSIFFYGIYGDTKNLYNIGKTEVDFIIQAPSQEQVSNISQLDHVDKITPYYYRSVNITSGKKTVATNLFIIDKEEDIEYTTFSNQLKVKTDSTYSGNTVYTTDEFAKNAGVNVGDTLNISIDGTALSFTVAGIYKSDHRQVGGSLLSVLTDEIKSAMSSMKYSGAYIVSNNNSASDSYFMNEYTPMGDLRSREEFDSDESYNTYLEAHNQADTTMSTFVTADYLSEIARRNEAKLLRNLILSIAVMVTAYILMIALITVRASNYTKNGVLRDVRDNFTVEQETRMYSKYFSCVCVLMLISNAIAIIVGTVLGWTKILSIPNIIAILITVVAITVCGTIQKNKLKNRFLVEQKKYEDGQKKKEDQLKMAKDNVE